MSMHKEMHKEMHRLLEANFFLFVQINVAGGFFAIKRLKRQKLSDFQTELTALTRFNGKVHPHLVTLLGTFSQGGHHNLIFPWAECDLDKYWETHPNPNPHSAGLIGWISKQCMGIMEAISFIHGEPVQGSAFLSTPKPFGRHGDIKAENILWYKSRPGDPSDRGILVLSDFGLAAMHSEKSRSMEPNFTVSVTPSFRPPECEIEGAKVTRAFDIWTLGCLFLELACWLLRGKDGKQRFDDDRNTPFIRGTNADVYFDIQQRLNDTSGQFVFMVKEVVSRVRPFTHLHSDPK